ncbi:hypothetical protein ACFYY1_42810 [Streptomyces sp. NPDC001890]|uniref:hypothetical protein n=1 Tax=Streptomyces sp. NPDC001890 TaxID=3364620 RepID=UPI0036A54FB8
MAPLFDFRALPASALNKGASATGSPPATRVKPQGAASDDELSAFSVDEVARWYRRLALHIQSRPGQADSLSALMMLHWLDGKGKPLTFPSTKLEKFPRVKDELKEVRAVFLTEKKAKLKGGEKWAGILPRIQKLSGFDPWDGTSPVRMTYTPPSVEIPLSVQGKAAMGLADPDELDLLMSLHSFGLNSAVIVMVTQKPGTQLYNVEFAHWGSMAFDRYDWDPTKHITVPNPDFGNPSRLDAPVAPHKATITVYHSNAKRVEAAGLADPYDAASKVWVVNDPDLVGGTTEVDASRKLK